MKFILSFLSVLLFLAHGSFAGALYQSGSDFAPDTKSYSDTSLTKTKRIKKKKQSDSTFIVTDSSNIRNIKNERVKLNKKKKSISEEPSPSADTFVQFSATPEEIAADIMESGNLNLKGNNFEQAKLYYDRVIKNYSFTSSYPGVILSRVRCYLGLDEEDAALNDLSLYFREANCGTVHCAEAYYIRANIYFNSGKYKEAADDFSEAAKDSTFKNYKYCFFYRALCEGEQDLYIQSVLDFTKFLNLDNYKTISSAEALYYRGFYKVKLSDNRGAISDYDRAIELYKVAVDNSKDKKEIYLQKLIDTYITRALAKADIKKFNEAILDYNTVIKMNPNYAVAYRMKGLAEIGKGDLDKGCMDLSKAGELGSVEAYNDIKQHCK